MEYLGFTAEVLLCGKKGIPGKCASSSRWEWYGVLVSGFLHWVEPHVSLRDPLFVFQVRPEHPAFSLALSRAWLALSIFIPGVREKKFSLTYRPHGSPFGCPQPQPPSIGGFSSYREREERSWAPLKGECKIDDRYHHDTGIGQPTFIFSSQSFSPPAYQWGLQGPAHVKSQGTKPTHWLLKRTPSLLSLPALIYSFSRNR